MPIAIQIDQQQIRDLEAALGKGAKEIPRIIRQAVNGTANSVEKRIVDELATDLPITKKAIRGGAKGKGKNISIKKAFGNQQKAVITMTGKRIPLSRFKAKQTKKGVTAIVQKSVGRKVFKSAFLATMDSGHKGAFLRSKDAKPKPPKGNTLPIIELRGPSVMHVFNKTIAARVDTDATKLLQKNIDRLLKLALAKRKEAGATK